MSSTAKSSTFFFALLLSHAIKAKMDYAVLWTSLLCFSTLFGASRGSVGDQDTDFRLCTNQCQETGCANLNCFESCRSALANGKEKSISRHFLLWFSGWQMWDCASECKYQCMMQRELVRHLEGQLPVQYHGKWPFKRLLRLQEPASAVFSIANLAMHLEGWISFLNLIFYKLPQKCQGRKSPYYEYSTLWIIYGILAINSWFWSAIFHSRDVVFTERMDYLSAVCVIGYTLIVAIIRTMNVKAEATRVIVASPIIAFVATHMLYLNLFNFDYAFAKDNPTTIRPLPVVPYSNLEVVQGIQSTTKKTSKGLKTVHVDNDSLDGSDVSPLIRKKGKSLMTATSSRSRASQSILERPTSERRPLQRKIGREFDTCVDALLVDVADIDDFARLGIREWFENSLTTLSQMEYHRHGVRSSIVARLIFADFPTSMLVHGLHIPLQGVEVEIPDWNIFDVSLVMGVMEIANTHLADEGFLVTLCLAQELGTVLRCAEQNALQLHRSWTLDIDGGYVHPQTQEQVTDVTIGLFYHKNMPIPSYDRLVGQEVSPQLFPASRSCITEGQLRASGDYTTVDGVLVRGGAERSKTFFSWLLATFTQHEDYVIDVFAGCGGLGAACSRDLRHCLMLELDAFVFNECLQKLVCGPSFKGGD